MGDLGTLACALLALAGLLYKLRELRRDPHNPAVRAVCGLLGSFGTALLVGWKPIFLWLGDITGVPNLAVVGRHGLAMAAAGFAYALANNMGDPQSAGRRGRLRWVLFGVALVAMIVLFAMASVHQVAAPDDFTDRYGTQWPIALYLLIFLTFMALSVVSAIVTNTRYGRHASARSLLRVGIRITTTSAFVGLAYIAHKALYIALDLFGLAPAWDEWRVSRVLVVVGVALLTIGLLLPSLGRLAGSAIRWPRRYRLYRALHPLWEAIYEVVPQVVLNPPSNPGRDPLIVRQLTTALYRRVIEISDGIMLLRPGADLEAVARAGERAKASGHSPADVEAIMDATVVATALRGQVGVLPTPTSEPVARSADTSDEAASHFAQVARALTASPIVQQAVGGRTPSSR